MVLEGERVAMIGKDEHPNFGEGAKEDADAAGGLGGAVVATGGSDGAGAASGERGLGTFGGGAAGGESFAGAGVCVAGSGDRDWQTDD